MIFKKNGISLKRLLTISITLLVVLTGFFITILSYFSSRELGYTMASTIIKENSDKVIYRVKEYLNSAYKSNDSFCFLINSGKLKPNGEEINDIFRYYLEKNQDFAGIYIGKNNGDFIYVKRMEDNSISTRSIVVKDDVSYSSWIHENEKYRDLGFNNSVYPSSLDFNVLNRTWYKGALESKGNTWSNIYKFASDGKLGITNSQPVYMQENLLGVLGIDLALSNISDYLNALDLARYGEIVILNRENRVIASSSNTLNEDLVVKSYYSFLNNTKKNSLTIFNFDNRTLISDFNKYYLGQNIEWKIGIIFPKEYVLGRVHSATTFIIVIAIIFILIASLIGLKISHDISTPINLICSDMKRMCKLDLEGELEISTDLREIQEIDKSFVNLKKGIRSFSKYVPSKLVARLISMGREAVLGGERRVLTVMFTDIVDFTTISEEMDPENLVEELADYLGDISRIIHINNGTVDKYIGDSIMAFWNAPEDVNSHASLACNAALQIQKYLDEYKEKYPGKLHFKTRIGINTGEVLVGNIGSEDRMNYTVMGDNINLGSRLESLNKAYGTRILISKRTMELASNAFITRAIDKVRVKGRNEATLVYELIGYSSNRTEKFNNFLNLYNLGIGSYFKFYLDESIDYLSSCLEIEPEDTPTKYLLKKAISLKEKTPIDNWDGVYEPG